MLRSELKKSVTAFLLLIMPAALCAQNVPTAVIFGTGTVYLNGAPLTNSSAITAGDVIQTRDNGAATITANGSSLTIDSNSIVRFQGDGFALDRGGLSISTGKGMSIYARDFKITPASGEWTQFYVTRSSGTIGIIARKNSVTITCGASSSTVKEGQQVSREDAPSCGLVTKGNGAPVAVKGPILTSQWAERGALIGAGGLLLYSLAHSDDPVSPPGP